MTSDKNRENRESATTSLCILLFVILLAIKAAGYDLSWGVVTSPIWGRFLFLFIVEIIRGEGR